MKAVFMQTGVLYLFLYVCIMTLGLYVPFQSPKDV